MSTHYRDEQQRLLEKLDAENQKLRSDRDKLAEINGGLVRDHNALLIDGARWQSRYEKAEEQTTRLVDAERRRWYAALDAIGITDIEGLAPEMVAQRVKERLR